MRTVLRSAATLGTALAMYCAGTAEAATEPKASTYNQYQYVIDSASTPPGLTSCNPVGTTLGGYFVYPGPSLPGAASYGAGEGSTTMHMLVCTYPNTPAAGASTWSGSEGCTETYLTGAPTGYTVTFSAKIVYVDANSWLEQRTISYPVTGGSCQETRNVGLMRTGK